jgi:hypothetical protein
MARVKSTVAEESIQADKKRLLYRPRRRINVVVVGQDVVRVSDMGGERFLSEIPKNLPTCPL